MNSNVASNSQVINVFKQLAAKWNEYKLKTSDVSAEARAAQRVAVMNFKSSSTKTPSNASVSVSR